MTTRLRHKITGEVREFPDRQVRWQLERHNSPFELADKPAKSKRARTSTSKRAAAKPRKSTAKRSGSGTVPVDAQTSDAD